jgi:hypothetical protein
MNLAGNNKHDGMYLAVAASSNQLPQHFAFNDCAKPTDGLSNRDVTSETPAKGFHQRGNNNYHCQEGTPNRQGHRSRSHKEPLSGKTCDPRFLPRRLLNLHIIRKSKRSIGVLKYIPTGMSLLYLVGVSSSLFFLQRRPTSTNQSSAAMSFSPSRLVLSAMYHFQSGILDSRSLIRVTQRSIRRSHCLGPAPCMLMMLMDWAIPQTRSPTLLSIRCVVKPPLSCQIPMVSAAHWLTPTLAFSAQTRTCRVSIWMVLASATTDFGNQNASHYILGTQRWSMIEWWISSASYSKKASRVLNISSRVMRCGSRGEEGVSKALEIVSKVGSQVEYIYGLGGFS